VKRPKPIDATLHGATDYTVGSLLLTIAPRLMGVEGSETANQVRVAGAIHAGYSTLTDYPLGIVKWMPYKVHLAIDAVGAVAVAATPFLTGQFAKGRRHWVPHVGLALFELSSLLLSDPSGLGDKKTELETVRSANQEDPHRKIEGPLAVQPAAAIA
jgi:hypothetical protein